MSTILNLARGASVWRTSRASKSNQLQNKRQRSLFWSIALLSAIFISLLRTLAVIAVIVTGLLWFTGRASTAVLVTVIIGIAIVFSAESIVGLIAG